MRTERQRRMLQAMGVALPPQRAAQAAPVPATAHASPAAADTLASAVRHPARGSTPPLAVDGAAAARDAAESAAPGVRRGSASAPPPAAVPADARANAPAKAPAATLGSPVDPARIETMDWQALRAAVEGCRACALCATRRQTVFGVGHPQAHWMVVGEAPGEQEDRQGEPFVGPAGRLLDAMLGALGLSREAGPPERQVFIANTLKCRPPHNRNPEPAELAQCEPYLQRQIALVRPRVILAMGRFAVQSLLRSGEPIGRLRGRVHAYQGVPLVVTYHPAYLLRNQVDKARAWDDLCLAAEVADAAAAAAGAAAGTTS